MTPLILSLANALAFLAVITFITQYSLVRWERTPEGRNTMATSAAVLLLVSTYLVRRLADLHLTLVVVAYLAVAAVFVWRSLVLMRAQREARATRERS